MANNGEEGVQVSFQRSVEEFLAVDDKIKTVAREAKELRQNKTVLEDAISAHMLDNDLEQGTFDASTVRVVKKKKTSNAFTRSNVQQCSLNLFGAEGAESLLRMIDGMKETTESHGIKRTRTN